MIQPNKHKYLYYSPLTHAVTELDNKDIIYKTIKLYIIDSTILQIKGHGSKVSNYNWQLFLNTPTFQPDNTNVHLFNQFNYKVLEWCKINITDIHTNKVFIQYDGDKLLENNYEHSDTFLQNYTGIILD